MTQLRLLIVDDSEADAVLIIRELRKAGYSTTYRRAETAAEMEQELARQDWDAILCDHSMPNFSSFEALKVLHLKPRDVPFIVVSGQIGEDTAVEAMKAGAHDYVMKGSLKRLAPAIKRELAEAVERRRRREVEIELAARAEELRLTRRMETIKDEFISMVSHEIKTPLTIIIGALGVAMNSGVTPEQTQELMHDAATSADALSAIVDNLLELSRYQSNRLSIETEKTNIGTVVRTVLDRFRHRSSLHRLVADVQPGLPTATVDHIRVERVLYNLVENAIKYSPKGGQVKVSASRDGDEIVISVSDQGVGIKPENLPRLFKSFSRLDLPVKGVGGLGLGLRVCQILVSAHAGRIWVESAPGKGSTFFFSLPIAEAGSAPG